MQTRCAPTCRLGRLTRPVIASPLASEPRALLWRARRERLLRASWLRDQQVLPQEYLEFDSTTICVAREF